MTDETQDRLIIDAVNRALAAVEPQYGQTLDHYLAQVRERAAAEVVSGPMEYLRGLGHLLRTQDNRITAHPVFVVEQKTVIGGVDLDYQGEVAWVADGVEVTDAEEFDRLEASWDADGVEPEGYRRTGKIERWDFVTACFTDQGCRDYLKANGHNLRSPRVYVHGAWRNSEWQQMREWLMALPAPAVSHG